MLDVNLGVRTAVSGLNAPVGMAFIGPNDMLVIEKGSGRVKRVVNGVVQATLLDLAVNNIGERGLLGIALDPAFSTNRFVYLYWSCSAPAPSNQFQPSVITCPDPPATGPDLFGRLEVPLLGNRVDKFRLDGSRLVFVHNLIKLRLFQNDSGPIPPGQNDEQQGVVIGHNGGVIRFGPDGKLYIVVGDHHRRGFLQNLPSGPTPTGYGPLEPDDQFGGPGQDNEHFGGVIIRLNSNGSIPPDNPFYAFGANIIIKHGPEFGRNLQRTFAYGIRNSFGLAFDPLTNRLWDQENGDDTYDEINRVPAGMNSGWIQIQGPRHRFADFRFLENTSWIGNPPKYHSPGGLLMLRWPAANLAANAQEALRRVSLPAGMGAFYKDPEFSWKWSVAVAGIGFQNGPGLGPRNTGRLFVALLLGSLLRFDLTPDRMGLDLSSDPRLADRVADNIEKHDIRESEKLMVGTNFGIVSQFETGPNGSLYAVSLSRGAIYEIFHQPATVCASNVTGLVTITRGPFQLNPNTGRFTQMITIRNHSLVPIQGIFTLAFDGLSSNATLFNSYGETSCAAPAGSPYTRVLAGADNVLSPNETISIVVAFTSTSAAISYTPRLLAGKARR